MRDLHRAMELTSKRDMTLAACPDNKRPAAARSAVFASAAWPSATVSAAQKRA